MINTSRNPSASRDPATLVVSAIAAQVIGGLFAQMSPFVVAGLMEGLSLSEREAGIIASVELLVLAVTAISLAPILPRVSYRRVCLIAVGLTLLAQGASIFGDRWTALVVLRGLAGVGEGVLYAMSLSIVASHTRNPEKIFGYFQLVWAIGSVALFSAGGELTAAFAHRGIFALLACITLALAPLLILLPDNRPVEDKEVAAGAPILSPLVGVMLFVAIVFYMAMSAALYAFSAPLGERAGLNTAAVGYTLTIASLVGLVGAAAATAFNVRWGRAIPISAFCCGYALVALALCLWQDRTAYVAAVVGSVVLYYFSMPYLFGLAAAIDRSGRWAAAAGSAYLLGFAAGPVLGGVVISAAGYASLAAVCVAMAASAWSLAMIVVSRGLSEESSTAEFPT
jgi:predicted MFS family arabinose efflux permease